MYSSSTMRRLESCLLHIGLLCSSLLPMAPRHFPNMDKKLRLLPIFWTLSALLSLKLFSVGIAGRGGPFVVGLGVWAWVSNMFSSLMTNSLAFGVRRLRLRMTPSLEFSFLFSSPEVFDWFSISPSSVVPLVARNSSAIPTKRTTPRSGVTPRDSLMNAWMRAALRLFVVGWIWDGRAVMVKI